jgi:nicotinamide-nucleotide amidase
MTSLRGAKRRSNLRRLRSPRPLHEHKGGPRDDREVRASLICVGSELLRGKINTHSSTLARRLMSVGIHLSQEQTLGDDLQPLSEAIHEAIHRFPVVVVTGGLGPTFDDITREAAAEALGRPLLASGRLLRGIQAKFRRALHRRMPPANARQAQVIQGARAIRNDHGTAPGQWIELKNNRVLILLPGPPRELKPMMERFVTPNLKRLFPSRPREEAHFHFASIPESVVDQRIRPLIARLARRKEVQIEFTILASLGLVDFSVFVSSSVRARARQLVHEVSRFVQRRLGPYCYGVNDAHPLEKVIGNYLRQAGATVATAESCTGGMLGARLTDQPGSSNFYLGGVVAYSNAMKVRGVGVTEEILRKHGAVSKPVAVALAEGIRERFSATYGVGITGVAGPSGGTPRKPVGLVYIAVAGPSTVRVQSFRFPGARDAIRQRAVNASLDALRKTLDYSRRSTS